MIKMLSHQNEPPTPILICDACGQPIELKTMTQGLVLFPMPIEWVEKGKSFTIRANQMVDCLYTHESNECFEAGKDILYERYGTDDFNPWVWPLLNHFFMLFAHAGMSDNELRKVRRKRDQQIHLFWNVQKKGQV